MPELPEVETVVRTLRPRLLSRRIARVELTRSDIVTPPDFDLRKHLTGRIVTSITRRGKRIVVSLDDQNCFYVHLGMTGRLTIEPASAPLQRHTHLIAHLSDRGRERGVQLRFRDPRRFGGIWWLGRGACDERIGPEPLSLRPAQLAQRLARTARAIKNVLLDQTVLAGIGNIYADEALFEARIHPLVRANELSDDQVRRLNRALKITLRRALRRGGSSVRDYVDANGESGSYQLRHRVYDREGKPCSACGSPVRRIVIGGRSSHFCPACQPAAASQSITLNPGRRKGRSGSAPVGRVRRNAG
jgi:formamidopyrimidine-DNA glycosylase